MLVKNLEELIELAQALKAEHGNLPAVTLDPLYLTETPLYLRVELGQHGKYLIVGDTKD